MKKEYSKFCVKVLVDRFQVLEMFEAVWKTLHEKTQWDRFAEDSRRSLENAAALS